MPLLELPHAVHCLVCGRGNPQGLKLSLYVDPATGQVQTSYTPNPEHMGFESIVHGGILATVLDEAMVWAASWRYRRFCLCAEMTVRFLRPAKINQKLQVSARVESFHSRMTTATGSIHDEDGQLVAEASGKYMPMDKSRHRTVVASMFDEPGTAEAVRLLLEPI